MTKIQCNPFHFATYRLISEETGDNQDLLSRKKATKSDKTMKNTELCFILSAKLT